MTLHRPFNGKCYQCKRKISFKSTRRLFCDEKCSKIFHHRLTALRHMKERKAYQIAYHSKKLVEKYGAENLLKCPKCGQYKQYLARHMATHKNK